MIKDVANRLGVILVGKPVKAWVISPLKNEIVVSVVPLFATKANLFHLIYLLHQVF